jgi:hypothetical protein
MTVYHEKAHRRAQLRQRHKALIDDIETHSARLDAALTELMQKVGPAMREIGDGGPDLDNAPALLWPRLQKWLAAVGPRPKRKKMGNVLIRGAAARTAALGVANDGA